ncbi:hypothetical protein EG329_004071 [Mollisiaceae sp. DMI_Dod_QoI]|nr:hypothetical protein EG329_004071 [Helotiales sp. DMI_Dod_QoI]
MYIYGEPHQLYNSTSKIVPRIISSPQTIEGGFNREQCLPLVQQMLNVSTSLSTNTSFFWQDRFGHIWSDYEHPIIRDNVCEQICGGSGMGWYPDIATRLLTWFIPGIFLVSSINLAPIGINRFVAISHLFGDPIHSCWSLLSKLEDWNKCYAIAETLHSSPAGLRPGPDKGSKKIRRPFPSRDRRKSFPSLRYLKRKILMLLCPIQATTLHSPARDTAAIIAAIKEIIPPTTSLTIQSLLPCSCSCSCSRMSKPSLATLQNQTAGNIIDKRLSSTLQTWFAILTYIFGIICTFVPVLGASPAPSAPSGGKIAPAMLLSWMLPNILLGNIVGQFRAEDCVRIIRQLEKDVQELKAQMEGHHEPTCEKTEFPLLREWTRDTDKGSKDWELFLDSLAWDGSIYSCELEKPMFEWRFRSCLLLTVAATSVFISFGISFRVLYSYPTFFSCRNIMIVGIMFVWVMSPFLTRIIMTSTLLGKYDKKTRWKILFCKDYLITFSVIFLLVASSCGLGNSCKCWAGFGNKIRGVVLNPEKQFTENNNYVYPVLIGLCLIGQYLVFKMALYMGRRGLRVMTWSKEDRRASLPERAGC